MSAGIDLIPAELIQAGVNTLSLRSTQ